MKRKDGGDDGKVVDLPIKNMVRRDQPRFDRCVVLGVKNVPPEAAEALRFDLEVHMGVTALRESVEGKILLNVGPHMFDMEEILKSGQIMRDRIMQATGRK